MHDRQYLLPEIKPSWRKQITWERLFTAAAFVISLLAVVFSFLQYRAADRQADIAEQARLDAKAAMDAQGKDVERARKAAEESAKAAQTLAEGMAKSAAAAEASANAGQKALDLNRRALILSNAPLVTATESKLNKALSVDDIPEIVTELINGGKGTAYQFRATQWITVSKTRKRTFDYEPIPEQSITDITPRGDNTMLITSKLNGKLSSELLNDINLKKMTLYVYGRAYYHDNTLERPIKYTYYWCKFYNPLNAGPDKLLLVNCPEHNSTVISQPNDIHKD